MNRGILRGVGADSFLPRYTGGGDPALDGGVLTADSTVEGAGRLTPTPAFIPGGLWFYAAGTLVTNTNAALTLNRLVATPFDIGPQKVTFNGISIVTVGAASAGGVIRIGIYLDNGQGWPGVLLGDYGTVDAVAGSITRTIAINVSLTGRVWLAAVGQVAVGTVGCFSAPHNDVRIGLLDPHSVGGGTGYYHGTTQSGVLPNPWGPSSTLNISQGGTPRLYLTPA